MTSMLGVGAKRDVDRTTQSAVLGAIWGVDPNGVRFNATVKNDPAVVRCRTGEFLSVGTM